MNQPQVSVKVPVEQLKKGGPDFQVEIATDNVTNLAAFEFSLTYDSSVIKYVGVEGGSFLGSSGRQPECLEPRIEPGNPETLRFNCVTLGPPVSVPGGKAGPDGSGVLAIVTFSPVGSGETSLELKTGRLIAAELDARGMPAEMETTVQGATLDVASSGSGLSWALWGTVIGVGAAVIIVGLGIFVVRRRARGSGPVEGM